MHPHPPQLKGPIVLTTRPTSTPLRTSLTTLTVVLGVLLALTGCVPAADAENAHSPTESPSEAEPIPIIDNGAETPELEGAISAIRQYWAAFAELKLSGESAAYQQLTAEECGYCQDAITYWAEVYEQGDWVELEGDFDVTVNQAYTIDDGSLANVYFTLTSPAQTPLPDGGPIDLEKTETFTEDWGGFAEYDDAAGHWKVSQVLTREAFDQWSEESASSSEDDSTV